MWVKPLPAQPGSSRPLSIALVGAGNIAEHAFREFSQLPGVSISSVCSRPSRRRDAFCRAFNVENAFDSLHELLTRAYHQSGAADAVFIATPNHLHALQAEQSLRAGKHVLLDKPLATNANEARRIVSALSDCEIRPVFLLGMNQRFSPGAARLREAVTEGKLGQVFDVRATWRRRAGIPQIGSWFGHRRFSGGGVLLDLGVHLLDLALFILGDFEVDSVTAQVRSVYGHRGLGYGGWGKSSPANLVFDVEDTANARIVLRSGIVVHLDLAWAAPIEQTEVFGLELIGDSGSARLDSNRVVPGPRHQSRDLERRSPLGGGPESEKLELELQQPLLVAENRYAHFIDLIREQAQPLISVDQAMRVQSALDAIYQSAAQGCEVRVGRG